jgi:S1-C subfamily serine protease
VVVIAFLFLLLVAASSSGNRQIVVPRGTASRRSHDAQPQVERLPGMSASGRGTPVTAPIEPEVTPSLPDVIARVKLSVVRIEASLADGSGSLGSGFIVDEDGVIATNFHVVRGASRATATFSDGTKVPVTGYLEIFQEGDLALLQIRIDGRRLSPLQLETVLPRQGERVFAYGSPEGLDGTATDGIVSAIRTDNPAGTLTLVQTSTPISHGNSGGPLCNERGGVVGVNTFGLRLPDAENLNFAVSAQTLRVMLGRSHGIVHDLRTMPK